MHVTSGRSREVIDILRKKPSFILWWGPVLLLIVFAGLFFVSVISKMQEKVKLSGTLYAGSGSDSGQVKIIAGPGSLKELRLSEKVSVYSGDSENSSSTFFWNNAVQTGKNTFSVPVLLSSRDRERLLHSVNTEKALPVYIEYRHKTTLVKKLFYHKLSR